MDATYLSGNEWIIYLYALVSNVCFSFVVHTACNCMDATCLRGNAWIYMPLRDGKWEL